MHQLTANRKQHALGLLIISFIAFISLGIPDGLMGVAWPGIRCSFNLPVDALGITLVFGTAGYMISSFFSGVLIRRLGIGGLLSISCAATGLALLVYAFTPVWWLFVCFTTVGGIGAGAIDAGINTFVAKHYSTRLMQWLHACFGVGITMGPIIMTLAISATSRWQVGYIIVGLAQITLALMFFVTKRMWKNVKAADIEEHHTENEAPLFTTMRLMPAQLSMLMFFLYTGFELGLGIWMYSLLTESRGVAPPLAGMMTGNYWAMFTVGRIAAGWYTSKLGGRMLIYLSISLALVGVGLLIMDMGPWMSIIGIGLAGFSIAPIFPGMVSDTESRVGRTHQSNTIGMQTAAAGLGAAVIPSIAGVLATTCGLEAIPRFLFFILTLLLASFSFSHRPHQTPRRSN